jgi:hypothetical protein
MKLLLALAFLCALAAAVLLVPIQGGRLWSRGAAGQVGRLVAHGLRASWDAIADEKPARRSVRRVASKSRPQGIPGARANRDGIVPQPPREELEATDKAALDLLVTQSR